MAIAYDSNNKYTEWDTVDNNVSGSHTMGSGNNGIVIVGSVTQNVTLSSLTYGGNAMTQIATVTNGSNHYYLHYYLNPSSGSNTVSLTVSGNDRKSFVVTSYFGVDQSSPIDVSNTGTGTNSASADLTTTVSNAWLTGAGNVGASITGFSGITARPAVTGNSANYGDSNGGVSTGLNSISISGTGDAGIVTAALTPASEEFLKSPVFYGLGLSIA